MAANFAIAAGAIKVLLIKPSCWSRTIPSGHPRRIFELGFFVVKQLLNRAPLRRISDAQQCPVVLDVLPYDKTLHRPSPRARLAALALELDQCGVG